MITHVFVARLEPEPTADVMKDWLDDLSRLRIKGMHRLVAGRDLSLREGNWDFSVTADFEDVDAYKRFADDPDHKAIGEKYRAKFATAVDRVQYERPYRDARPGIRNVTLIALEPGSPPGQIERIVQRLNQVESPGLLWIDAGLDLGLQDGNAQAGNIADLDDEAAYRAYDTDELHNEIRRVDVFPYAKTVARVQFRLDSGS